MSRTINVKSRGRRRAIASTVNAPARRRGSVYIMVLMVSSLLAVIGVSSLLVIRIQNQMVQRSEGTADAADLAFCGVEHALTMIADNPAWRATYVHDTQVGPFSFSGGTFEWRLLDEAPGGSDANLADDDTDPVRIRAKGIRGNAVRQFSVLMAPGPGGQGMDVLDTAVYSTKNISLNGTTTASGGPLVSLGTLTNNNTFNGDVEANILVNPGTINGTTQTPATVRQTPSSTLFDNYLAQATQIPYSSLSTGNMQNIVLSAATNPYGTANPDGVYHVTVPPGVMMQVVKCRIVGTLMVTLGTGSTFKLNQANRIETPPTKAPVLLIKAASTGYVDLNGTQQALAEASLPYNYNPPGTPYLGVSDIDVVDQYASEVKGVIHVFGPLTETSLNSSFNLTGTLITSGNVGMGSNASITVNVNIRNNPPAGYSADGPMQPVANSWRWEVAP